MITLVQPKESKEIRRRRVGASISFPFPMSSIQVVALADDSSLSNVQCLSPTIKMDETPGQFEIRVRNSARGIVVSNHLVDDMLGPR